MNVVYVIQSGNDGPVTLGVATDKGWSRRLRSLQAGNPTILTVVHLLDGDERLERELHVRWTPHRLRGDWYRAAVLDDMPDLDARKLDVDPTEETRRQAAMEIHELARPRTP